MIKVGIVGASGYMGGEALRVLLDHPDVNVAWGTSRTPSPIEEHHPNLYGTNIELIHPDNATPCDVVFLALPTAASIEAAAKFLDQGCKVIDLGSAFRLSDRALWETVYGQTHSDWPLAQEAVYGIAELHKDEIAKARLVANPGCFSSAAILGLAPLIKQGLIDEGKIVVDGLSGTTGAGAELSRAAHHPEIGNNLIPYNVVSHRHTFEMEQELSALAGNKVRVHFTPTYVPIVRGILDVCHTFPKKTMSRDSITEIYREYYANEPFVEVYDRPKDPKVSWQYKPYPWVSTVAGTNYCFIGVDVDEARGRIVLFSVLDSIGKGGAQVGIENMNLMFGLERTAGLTRRGAHPN
ncbi:MAG: N-acetyl-gamma-glutamyl-phosphate reductase [Gammaproteobacteria bacterium]|jgi:N-acetyl-gamma-glutamyl-phosphate reductase common form|nr:N-acetyl-gamma-glutamyl-phosphate reductase [Gammaproteobacteria bacterium]